MNDLFIWVAVALASIVSLLTLSNAAKLKTGVLAISTYAFGGGMLSLAASFAVLQLPLGADLQLLLFMSRLLFVVGFLLLGFGSFKIYQMSQIK